MTSLWQITDGKKLAQLIFSRDKLIGCEIVDGGDIVDEFLDKFVEENKNLLHSHNRNSRETRRQKYLESSNSFETDTFLNSNITVIHLERLHQIPEKILKLMNFRSLQKKCNQLHKHIRQQLQSEKKNFENEKERYAKFS